MSSYAEFSDSSGVTRLAGTLKGGGQVAPATTLVAYANGSGGSDSNDGSSWSAAKATLGAAISLFPVSADGVTRNGTVYCTGTFNVSSSHRTDAGCATTNNSKTVTDTHCVASDVGAFVTGTNITGTAPNFVSQIVSVTPGVSFVLNFAATGTGSGLSLTITKPGVYLPPGITLQGTGSSAASGVINTNFLSMTSATLIQDNGTDVAVGCFLGAGEDNTAVRYALRDLSIWGNSGNTVGLVTNCNWFGEMTSCDVSYHGAFGAIFEGNSGSGCTVINTLFTHNGLASTSATSGGVGVGSGAFAGLCFIGCAFIHNFGVDVTGVCSLIACQTAETQITNASGSGQAVVTQPGSSGTFYATSCWFEGTLNTGSVITVAGTGAVFNSCMIRPTNNVSVNGIKSQATTLSVDGCFFQGATGSSITVDSTSHVVHWRNCGSSDTHFIAVTGGHTIATTAATGIGSVGSASVMFFDTLPTADPHVAGQWWANAGVVTVSAG